MRTKLAPATGTCEWLDNAPNGNRRIRINGTIYEVYQRVSGGFILWKDDTTAYTIDTTFGCGVWMCNCSDALYRPERRHTCKHVLGLRAALRALPF